MADGAALGLLVTVKNALAGLYTDVFDKLSADRASKLDNLPNLTGPVALQQNLGTIADAEAMNAGLMGALNLLLAQAAGIDDQLRQINAAQQSVYTGNIPNPNIFSGQGGLHVPLSTGVGGQISWATTQYGSPITSVKVFSPELISQHQLQGLAGTGMPARALQIILNGVQPASVGQLAAFVATQGNSGPPYAGLTPQISLGWNGSAYTLTGANSTTSTTVNLGGAVYPLVLFWEPGQGLVATTANGFQQTLADHVLPAPTAMLSLLLWANSGLSVIACGYS
jgi:hypothetical protein